MSKSASVAVCIGSLRKASFSRKVANALIAQAPASLSCRIVEIGDLPLYNEDLDGDPPESWTRFRSEIANSDAILFVTPEYNRSMPGCLKNAVDVGSRPAGKNLFDGLPAAVVSVTPYKLGAFGANHALRQTFVFLNLLVMQQPEAYIRRRRRTLRRQRGAHVPRDQNLFRQVPDGIRCLGATTDIGVKSPMARENPEPSDADQISPGYAVRRAWRGSRAIAASRDSRPPQGSGRECRPVRSRYRFPRRLSSTRP